MPHSSSLRKTRSPRAAAAPKPEGRRVFQLLNTSLGTWVLSALFLTLGPYIWQSLENHFKQQAARQAETYRRSRLVEEFAYRLSVSYARLEALQPKAAAAESKPPDIQRLEWALGPLLSTSDAAVPLFRENKELSAVSLLAEINLSLANTSPLAAPERVVQMRHLRKRIDALSKISGLLQQHASASTLKAYLRFEIDYDLWRETGYSFLKN